MKHVTIKASWFVGHVTVIGMIVVDISGSIIVIIYMDYQGWRRQFGWSGRGRTNFWLSKDAHVH